MFRTTNEINCNLSPQKWTERCLCLGMDVTHFVELRAAVIVQFCFPVHSLHEGMFTVVDCRGTFDIRGTVAD